MPTYCTPQQALVDLYKNGVITFDVRSPKEHKAGNFNPAFLLPLLNDDHRHQIGIRYKEQGNQEAVKLGYELVGPLFDQLISQAKFIAQDRPVHLFCWRGGQRSHITAELLEGAGMNVSIVRGGYKAMRNTLLSQFLLPRKGVVLSGETGSGKTEILHCIQEQVDCVIDLEGLAHHKGSAFGSLGQPEQPTQEQFENELALRLFFLPIEQVVFIENESRMIGKLRIPDGIFTQIQTWPMARICRPKEERVKRILEEYGHFGKEELRSCTLNLSKRMGNELCNKAVLHLENDEYVSWVNALLQYYDKGYAFALEKKPNRSIEVEIRSSGKTSQEVAQLILKQWKQNH